MRPADCPQKMALAYSAPPAIAAGIAQARMTAIAMNTLCTIALKKALLILDGDGCHKRTRAIKGMKYTNTTGPLVSMPSPRNTPLKRAQKMRSVCANFHTLITASWIKTVSIRSNMIIPEYKNQPRKLIRINGDNHFACGESGYTFCASLLTRYRLISEKPGTTMRVTVSEVPNSAQMLLNSQNMNGGLWS